MFVNKLFTYLVYTYFKKGCFNMKSWTLYFQMKTKMLADFQICITKPLKDLFERKSGYNTQSLTHHACFL